ncbi:hypothetical protein EVU91_11645 [Macrococcoides bohemicum]|uniref:YopX family protein n=1 Tax=Macrococcoides bohemicum TaxID=1903056 RepID=UPI0010593549|nr:YopX family protein [Macrococcus bohemicus]TDL35697.1 hypothetical protein EVU91_11645 [Macrococcus bohemicus]
MIKFRVYDNRSKQILERPIIVFQDDVISVSSNKNSVIDDYVLMQSTGLVDEDYVEVWEGDIVWHSENEEYGIVEFDEAKFVIRWQENYVEDLFERIDILEVIGNVHEHSHLLEKENEG